MVISLSKSDATPDGQQLFAAPIEEVPLAFIDLEMTGLDPASDRVIEVCIERVRNGETCARMASLVLPSEPCVVDGGVHGLRAADLASAPSFSQLAARITELLGGAVLVAHAVKHDMAFLAAEYQRLGLVFVKPTYLDTLALARRSLERPAYGLAALAKHFGIANTQPHRAANDVHVTRQLFGVLRAAAGGKTLADLRRHGRHQVDVASVIARAQLALERGLTARVRYRVRGKPNQQLLFCTTAVRADLDPPRVLGYLLHSRGRRELRADRILALEIIDQS